jgi:hypothetical protein
MTKTFKLTPRLFEKLFSYGMENESICDALEITTDEFKEIAQQEEYARALKRGKARADFNMIEQLYQKAIGYEHTDYHFYSYQGELFTKEYTKRYPPDLPSIIFWLKNRRPAEWKEKVESGSELDDATLDKLRELAVAEMDKLI